LSLITNIRYQIADLTLNTKLGTAYRANEELTLPQLSYNLLCVLVQRAPAIVSQDDLMTLMWGEQVVSDETLKQRIKLLRQVLNDTPQSPKYIESVRGRGYRCMAQVTKTMIRPHDSINLRLHDRLPVSFLQSSEEYWRLVSIFFLLIFYGIFYSCSAQLFFTRKTTDAAASCACQYFAASHCCLPKRPCLLPALSVTR
jgi:DNA-binding winged helix-turn-helix (wHTH) protein